MASPLAQVSMQISQRTSEIPWEPAKALVAGTIVALRVLNRTRPDWMYRLGERGRDWVAKACFPCQNSIPDEIIYRIFVEPQEF